MVISIYNNNNKIGNVYDTRYLKQHYFKNTITNNTSYISDSLIQKIGYTQTTAATSNSVWFSHNNNNSVWFSHNNNGCICTTNLYNSWGEYSPPLSKREKFKRQIRAQLAPAIIRSRATSRGAQFNDVRPEELVALQLLRNMISSEIFKKYLKYGFVTVQGPSGLTYQIQRKSHMIKVWKMGKLLCELCVYLKDSSIPPTDEVVAKMLICECDEIDIWRRANISWHKVMKEFRSITSRSIDNTDLQEILRAA